jgi:hypothetical protein
MFNNVFVKMLLSYSERYYGCSSFGNAVGRDSTANRNNPFYINPNEPPHTKALPIEIFAKIFFHSDLPTLGKGYRVCKEWNRQLACDAENKQIGAHLLKTILYQDFAWGPEKWLRYSSFESVKSCIKDEDLKKAFDSFKPELIINELKSRSILSFGQRQLLHDVELFWKPSGVFIDGFPAHFFNGNDGTEKSEWLTKNKYTGLYCRR